MEVDTAQDEASAAVKALKRIFTIAIEKHELSDETEKEEMSADEKYKVWMRERFDEMVKKCCELADLTTEQLAFKQKSLPLP